MVVTDGRSGRVGIVQRTPTPAIVVEDLLLGGLLRLGGLQSGQVPLPVAAGGGRSQVVQSPHEAGEARLSDVFGVVAHGVLS